MAKVTPALGLIFVSACWATAPWAALAFSVSLVSLRLTTAAWRQIGRAA